MKKTIKLITLTLTASLLVTACQLFVKEPKFTVTWQNYDGTILEVDEEVKKGTTPTFDGANPERAQTDAVYYVWTGWTPELSEVSEDVTYTATFKEETRFYEITWNNYNGETLKTEEVAYGAVPEYDGEEPTREQTTEHTYSFEGWSPRVEAVTGNATYVASFEENLRKYEITWKDDDGTVLKNEEVEYGKTPSYGDTDPIKENTVDKIFSFNGWSPNVASVSGDATYVATYRSDVRTYEVTWKNYDGVVLKVDTVPYGGVPSYEGNEPVKKERGFESYFTGWSPEIVQVTENAEYVAQFSDTPKFSFEPVEYEMNNGYTLSDINGAPWINSNVRGELEKIKKPSLQDDFYASVNYDDLKSNSAGAFGISDAAVDAAFNEIYNGSASSKTTNGAIIKAAYDKISSGNVSQVSSYLEGINLDTYLSSKESFLSKNALFNLTPYGTGYEVDYTDGYQTGMRTGDYTYLGMLFLFEDLAENAKSIISYLSGKYSLGFTSTDVSSIASKENELTTKAYYDSYNYGTSGTNYTVNTVPWTEMKEALLDLGLSSSTKIFIKRGYYDCLDTIYSDLSVNDPSFLRKMIVSRLAYDNRFFLGISSYKELNRYISNMAAYFSDEAYLYGQSNSYVAKRLARAAFPELMEQTYIELAGDETVKAEVEALINDILAAYQTLANESWLGTTTKTKMKKKLTYMDYAACYSDYYRNIAKVSNTSDKTVFELHRSYRSTIMDEVIAKKVDDKAAYFNSMHSWTVNAFYSPTDNAFVILNGIVKGLLGTSIEEKYGMLAMVIGHEITHAFDSTGSQFNENGDQVNWWSLTDKATFNEKIKKLKAFYNQIALKKSFYCKGDTVDGEATADLGGMKVALMLAKKVENFDYDKFFRAYAYLWITTRIGLNEVESRSTDSHPFNYLRVNVVVSQFDEFIDTYDIKPGDGMYVPEEERIKVW